MDSDSSYRSFVQSNGNRSLNSSFGLIDLADEIEKTSITEANRLDRLTIMLESAPCTARYGAHNDGVLEKKLQLAYQIEQELEKHCDTQSMSSYSPHYPDFETYNAGLPPVSPPAVLKGKRSFGLLSMASSLVKSDGCVPNFTAPTPVKEQVRTPLYAQPTAATLFRLQETITENISRSRAPPPIPISRFTSKSRSTVDIFNLVPSNSNVSIKTNHAGLRRRTSSQLNLLTPLNKNYNNHINDDINHLMTSLKTDQSAKSNDSLKNDRGLQGAVQMNETCSIQNKDDKTQKNQHVFDAPVENSDLAEAASECGVNSPEKCPTEIVLHEIDLTNSDVHSSEENRSNRVNNRADTHLSPTIKSNSVMNTPSLHAEILDVASDEISENASLIDPSTSDMESKTLKKKKSAISFVPTCSYAQPTASALLRLQENNTENVLKPRAPFPSSHTKSKQKATSSVASPAVECVSSYASSTKTSNITQVRHHMAPAPNKNRISPPKQASKTLSSFYNRMQQARQIKATVPAMEVILRGPRPNAPQAKSRIFEYYEEQKKQVKLMKELTSRVLEESVLTSHSVSNCGGVGSSPLQTKTSAAAQSAKCNHTDYIESGCKTVTRDANNLIGGKMSPASAAIALLDKGVDRIGPLHEGLFPTRSHDKLPHMGYELQEDLTKNEFIENLENDNSDDNDSCSTSSTLEGDHADLTMQFYFLNEGSTSIESARLQKDQNHRNQDSEQIDNYSPYYSNNNFKPNYNNANTTTATHKKSHHNQSRNNSSVINTNANNSSHFTSLRRRNIPPGVQTFDISHEDAVTEVIAGASSISPRSSSGRSPEPPFLLLINHSQSYGAADGEFHGDLSPFHTSSSTVNVVNDSNKMIHQSSEESSFAKHHTPFIPTRKVDMASGIGVIEHSSMSNPFKSSSHTLAERSFSVQPLAPEFTCPPSCMFVPSRRPPSSTASSASQLNVSCSTSVPVENNSTEYTMQDKTRLSNSSGTTPFKLASGSVSIVAKNITSDPIVIAPPLSNARVSLVHPPSLVTSNSSALHAKVESSVKHISSFNFPHTTSNLILSEKMAASTIASRPSAANSGSSLSDKDDHAAVGIITRNSSELLLTPCQSGSSSQSMDDGKNTVKNLVLKSLKSGLV